MILNTKLFGKYLVFITLEILNKSTSCSVYLLITRIKLPNEQIGIPITSYCSDINIVAFIKVTN